MISESEALAVEAVGEEDDDEDEDDGDGDVTGKESRADWLHPASRIKNRKSTKSRFNLAVLPNSRFDEQPYITIYSNMI